MVSEKDQSQTIAEDDWVYKLSSTSLDAERESIILILFIFILSCGKVMLSNGSCPLVYKCNNDNRVVELLYNVKTYDWESVDR